MNLTVLVSSCDAYSDCWMPMLFSLKKYWPDCDYRIVFVSNHESIEGAEFIKVGDDRGWGSNLLKALKSFDSDYVLYLQDDYFLNKRVDNTAFNAHLDYCISHNVDYLRLSWPFRYKCSCIDNIYCEDKPGMRYALCLQPAIWKKSTLEAICKENMSGWEFEKKVKNIIASAGIKVRSLVLSQDFYEENGIVIVDGTGIRKGKFTAGGAAFLKSNGFDNVVLGRKVESGLTTFLMGVNEDSLLKLPANAVLRLMRYLK